jgi:uncharacterized hydrophobic protein (TIGR00271 family)
METVMRDIRVGSEARFNFYALLTVSSLIASIGLIAGSTAVIIGAMLVSPLMTPIFGIALAMLLGDSALFWKALAAEVLGVILAIAIALLLGMLPLAIEATPEMLARTKPNLLDLMVAVFAGFAGAYAYIDERVSPALPGVAIATAIVPPLSNAGLCLSLGAYSGAFGSFMLFVANFFAILLVGSLIFIAAGILQIIASRSQRGLVRKFLFTVACFAVVTILLTQSLITMVTHRQQTRIISDVVLKELAHLDLPSYRVENIFNNEVKGKVEVVVEVLSAKIITPEHVDTIQQALAVGLNKPVTLVIRTLPAHDIAATGSNAQITLSNLDGHLTSNDLPHWALNERITEQYLYEQLGDRLGLEIESIDFTDLYGTASVLVTLRSAIPLSSLEIRDLQNGLQKRLNKPDLGVAVQSVNSSVYTDVGEYRLEWTNWDTIENFEDLTTIKTIVTEEVEKISNLFTTEVHIHEEKGNWRVLAEVVGPVAPEPYKVDAIQTAVAMRFPHPVRVYIRFRLDTVITSEGYTSYNAFILPTRDRRTRDIFTIFRRKIPKAIMEPQ